VLARFIAHCEVRHEDAAQAAVLWVAQLAVSTQLLQGWQCEWHAFSGKGSSAAAQLHPIHF
jgi:hypothetical protein